MVADSQGFLLGWKVSELGGFFEEAGLNVFVLWCFFLSVFGKDLGWNKVRIILERVMDVFELEDGFLQIFLSIFGLIHKSVQTVCNDMCLFYTMKN